MRYIVLFFVMMVGHFAGLASAQGLRSGPMAGFTDMQSTTIWLQTDAPGLVELTYWPRRQGPSTSRVHQLQTKGLASNTAHMQLQGLAPGSIAKRHQRLHSLQARVISQTIPKLIVRDQGLAQAMRSLALWYT